jgi:predicted unusual protein kinase regulating ubiquinone biosynthesis (AarF/ABC1/UbiB family)
MYADDPKVIVPEVVGERSAQRVLTLTEETGDSLQTVQKEYSWEQKDTVGENLFRMFGEQMYRHGAIHADPNPANYAFRPDGRIVLYDYGCIKKIGDDQFRALVEVVRAGLDRDHARIEQALLDMGARVAGKPTPPDEFYDLCYDIFLEPVVSREMYDYGDAIIYERFRENIKTFIEYEAWFQPPPGNVYVDRTVVGVHNILRKMESRVPCRAIMDQMLEDAEARLARIEE